MNTLPAELLSDILYRLNAKQRYNLIVAYPIFAQYECKQAIEKHKIRHFYLNKDTIQRHINMFENKRRGYKRGTIEMLYNEYPHLKTIFPCICGRGFINMHDPNAQSIYSWAPSHIRLPCNFKEWVDLCHNRNNHKFEGKIKNLYNNDGLNSRRRK